MLACLNKKSGKSEMYSIKEMSILDFIPATYAHYFDKRGYTLINLTYKASKSHLHEPSIT
jgi:hypothetical protein